MTDDELTRCKELDPQSLSPAARQQVEAAITRIESILSDELPAIRNASSQNISRIITIVIVIGLLLVFAASPLGNVSVTWIVRGVLVPEGWINFGLALLMLSLAALGCGNVATIYGRRAAQWTVVVPFAIAILSLSWLLATGLPSAALSDGRLLFGAGFGSLLGTVLVGAVILNEHTLDRAIERKMRNQFSQDWIAWLLARSVVAVTQAGRKAGGASAAPAEAIARAAQAVREDLPKSLMDRSLWREVQLVFSPGWHSDREVRGACNRVAAGVEELALGITLVTRERPIEILDELCAMLSWANDGRWDLFPRPDRGLALKTRLGEVITAMAPMAAQLLIFATLVVWTQVGQSVHARASIIAAGTLFFAALGFVIKAYRAWATPVRR